MNDVTENDLKRIRQWACDNIDDPRAQPWQVMLSQRLVETLDAMLDGLYATGAWQAPSVVQMRRRDRAA